MTCSLSCNMTTIFIIFCLDLFLLWFLVSSDLYLKFVFCWAGLSKPKLLLCPKGPLQKKGWSQLLYNRICLWCLSFQKFTEAHHVLPVVVKMSCMRSWNGRSVSSTLIPVASMWKPLSHFIGLELVSFSWSESSDHSLQLVSVCKSCFSCRDSSLAYNVFGCGALDIGSLSSGVQSFTLSRGFSLLFIVSF